MERLRIQEVIIVEGRYDAIALASVVDGLIIVSDGYSIFSDGEKKSLIRKLGKERGLLILTDSDAAGFAIRNHVEKIAAGCEIKHAYIPAIPGKERRKDAPSKEGLLGVEAMTPEVLHQVLLQAGATPGESMGDDVVTHMDLYELGLSGQADSAQRRRALLRRLGLPPRLSKRALLMVLGRLYSRDEFIRLASKKPLLFWDFHGTLTLPDVTWFDVAIEAQQQLVPEQTLTRETLTRHFSATCLPWFSVEDRDTRHLTAPGAWWQHCEQEFRVMFQRCGFTEAQADLLAPAMREKILQPHRYQLYPDALQTLQTLKQRGYRSYVLSNNFPELEALTEQLGLSPLLEGVLSSGRIGYEKPRPEIFAAARAHAHIDEVPWMIGDNPVDDIEGAHKAGFVTVAVHNVPAAMADLHINALSEMLDLLPDTNQGATEDNPDGRRCP